MRIIGKRDIEKYMTRHANAATPLKCWVQKAEQSDWKTPAAIKADFASASFLAGNRVVFNIGGNNFRLVVIAVYVQGMLVVTGSARMRNTTRRGFRRSEWKSV